MLTHLKQALIFTAVLIVGLGLFYPLLIIGVARIAGPNGGRGEVIEKNGKVIGFVNIAQPFTAEKYFMSRPSAYNYDATHGSYGSNAGPSNPDYQATVQARIDTFLRYNPDIQKEQIPSELVTVSGSGLDPHLSPQAAYVQIPRIAHARGMNPEKIRNLVQQLTEGPMFGLFGPAKINVLGLNLALDEMK